MKVKALQRTYYDRRDRMPGDVYEMDDRMSVDIKILTALGKIELVDEVPAPVPPPIIPTEYQVAAIAAEEQPAAHDKTESQISPMTTDETTARRIYRRRDMRAQR